MNPSDEILTLRKAIKDKCLECCGGSRKMAKKCRNCCPLMGITDLQQPRKPKKELRRDGVQLTIKIYVGGKP